MLIIVVVNGQNPGSVRQAANPGDKFDHVVVEGLGAARVLRQRGQLRNVELAYRVMDQRQATVVEGQKGTSPGSAEVLTWVKAPRQSWRAYSGRE
jgi:hypothetical protein